jgi:DNA topoisomerase-2
MPLWSLTKERVEKLRRQIGDKEVEVDELIKLSKEDIWKKDLDDFLAEWKFQLADDVARAKYFAGLGRRDSKKLKTGARGPLAKKRKGRDDEDSDFSVPKPKKAATVNKVKPKGGLLDYLSKASPPRKSRTGLDGASDESDDLEPEILPTKRPRAAAVKPKPKVDTFDFSDFDDDDLKQIAAPPKKAANEPKETVAPTVETDTPMEVLSDLDDSEEEVILQTSSRSRNAASKSMTKSIPTKEGSEEPEVTAAPPADSDVEMQILSELDDDSEEEVIPQKTSRSRKAAPKAASKPAAKTAKTSKAKAAKPAEDSEMEDVVATSAPRGARASRNPVKYSVLSDSDDADDLLGDVSQMVKGIGGSGTANVDESRTLFSQLSRPSSGAGPMSATKSQKTGPREDETDYSKLIPSKSPRRSLLIKPKDVKHAETDDEEEDPMDDSPLPAKPAAKPAAKKAAAKPAPKAKVTASKAKAKAAPKATAPAKKQPLSAAAKAYASKKAKTSKALADDLSDDDDIDAMVDDILDSPPAKAAPAASARPSRRAAATTKKPAYTLDLDSEDDEDAGGADVTSEDEFYDAD